MSSLDNWQVNRSVSSSLKGPSTVDGVALAGSMVSYSGCSGAFTEDTALRGGLFSAIQVSYTRRDVQSKHKNAQKQAFSGSTPFLGMVANLNSRPFPSEYPGERLLVGA